MILLHLNLNPVIFVWEDDCCLTNGAFPCFKVKGRPSFGFKEISVRRGYNFGKRCSGGRLPRAREWLTLASGGDVIHPENLTSFSHIISNHRPQPWPRGGAARVFPTPSRQTNTTQNWLLPSRRQSYSHFTNFERRFFKKMRSSHSRFSFEVIIGKN